MTIVLISFCLLTRLITVSAAFRNVSAIMSCRCLADQLLDSEKDGAFVPLGLHALSVSQSPSTHCFAVLDTTSQADPKAVREGLYGKDVMVWGGNSECWRSSWLDMSD